MSNINVQKRLESVYKDLSKIANHISDYSGVSTKQAQDIQLLATDAATLAVQIASYAREVLGVSRASDTVLQDLQSRLG